VLAEHIEALFRQAECSGQLCVQSLDGTREIAIEADEAVVSASVFKVLVALVALTEIEEGNLDPRERIMLPGGDPVPGPVGFSLFEDDVQMSLRDLLVPMLTISDNVATDALLNRIGIDNVNRRAGRLGLQGTAIPSDVRTMIDSIGQDAGFASWNAMWEWVAQPHANEDEKRLVERIGCARALIPRQTTRTTARDMATDPQGTWLRGQ
jgi:beta-lactamase class A